MRRIVTTAIVATSLSLALTACDAGGSEESSEEEGGEEEGEEDDD